MTENLAKQNTILRPCTARRRSPGHVAICVKRDISGTANLLVISCRVLPWSTTAASPSNGLSSTLTRTALCPRLVAIYVAAKPCGLVRDGLKAGAPALDCWQDPLKRPRLARRTDRSCQGACLGRGGPGTQPQPRLLVRCLHPVGRSPHIVARRAIDRTDDSAFCRDILGADSRQVRMLQA